MQMFANLIQHQASATIGKTQLGGKVFQVFGFDILIDKDLKAWILEINDHPSFNIMYSKEFMGTVKSEETLSQVDLYVKKMAMTDALKMVLKKPEKLDQVENSIFSYSRVFPCSDPDHNKVGYTMFKIRELFYKLCSIKDKLFITSANFEKLYSHRAIKGSGLQRIDLSMMF